MAADPTLASADGSSGEVVVGALVRPEGLRAGRALADGSSGEMVVGALVRPEDPCRGVG